MNKYNLRAKETADHFLTNDNERCYYTRYFFFFFL